MSIEDELQRLVGTGDLSLLVPERRSFIVSRHVFCGGEARSFLTMDGTIDTQYESTSGRAASTLDRFSTGSFVTVGMDPHDKEAACQLARVDPTGLGIFDYRVRDPQPAVRIFGGFIKTDVLVLLTWHPRSGCDFAAEAVRCRKAWDALLPGNPPLTSDRVEDHVSAHFNIG